MNVFDLDSNSGIINWRWGCEYVPSLLLIYVDTLLVYMNIPISLVGFVVLLISLHDVQLKPSHDMSWQKLWQKFDFVGLYAYLKVSSRVLISLIPSVFFSWQVPVVLS
jgi:hypothetical protein